MVIHCITPSMKSSPCSVVCWLAETNITCVRYPFELSLNFSVTNEWTAVEKVTVENIPVDITFNYVGDEVQIELFSKIKDKKIHTVDCSVTFKVGEPPFATAYDDTFKFSNTSGVHYLPSFIVKQHLEEANRHFNKRLDMDVNFDYTYNSLITEIKRFIGDSTNVKDIAFNLNKGEPNCFLYLQNHLRNLLNEKTYADVKLRADGEVFFAHKCLLAIRSPVFRAMFDQDMLESKTNIIDIHDVEARNMKIFLEYLYTGAVDGMDDEIALSLLVVADKYQVSPLTEKCSSFLKSALSFDNVLDVLLVADMVNQEQLKVSAVEYIVENSTQVLSSPNWPQWRKTNSTIASEVLLKLSNKFDTISKSNTV